MTTYLDNIIRPCAQKAGLLLGGAILLAVLILLLSPTSASLSSGPAPATDANLISERNCLRLQVEAPNGKLTSQDLANIVRTYSHKEITATAERGEDISSILKLNKDIICGDANAETREKESLCFKERVGTICFPLN